MNTDLEDLLISAADDTDHPVQTSIDDIVRRGRRSVRTRRIASAAVSALTVAAVVGGVTTWSAHRGTDDVTIAAQPSLGPPDPETGKPVLAAPPVSSLSDAEIIRRCDPKVGLDDAGITLRANRLMTGAPAPGPVQPGWNVWLKTGVGDEFVAVLASPDHRHGIECGVQTFDDGGKSPRYAAFSLTADLYVKGYHGGRSGGEVAPQLLLPAGVTRVLVDVYGEPGPRELLLGKHGYFTLGSMNLSEWQPQIKWATPGATPPAIPGTSRGKYGISTVRGYDAKGRKVYENKRFFGSLPAR